MKITGKYLLALCILVVGGCASGIPQETLSRVTYQGTFARLQASPEDYTGQVALFGGRIISVENQGDVSTMEVVQFPLGGNFKPQPEKSSSGRFLVRSENFLDPAVYTSGSLVTVAGEVTGSQVRPIDEYQYTYPVLQAVHIRQWAPEKNEFPRFHFGVGVGTTF